MKTRVYLKFCALFFVLGLEISGQAQPPDKKILETIIKQGKETNSDGILIYQNNKLVLSEYYGKKPKPEYIASAGKSLVALGIGQLIDSGKILSLDQKVCDFYPEWKQGRKKNVTLRMLLNHTSGLQNDPNASVELEPAPNWKVKNIIQLALCAELSDAPGTHFSYNNKAVALLGGIIQKASGERMDSFFESHFFRQMDIRDYGWIQDEEGNPTAHGAFILTPADFAKFGLLVLNKGIYNGHRLVSEQWIDSCFASGQNFDQRFGLLWWRLPRVNKRLIAPSNFDTLQKHGVDAAILSRLRPLVGDTLSEAAFNKALAKAIGDSWYPVLQPALAAAGLGMGALKQNIISDDVIAYYANGYRGNFLVIIPSRNIVAVRVKGSQSGYRGTQDDFFEFVELASRL